MVRKYSGTNSALLRPSYLTLTLALITVIKLWKYCSLVIIYSLNTTHGDVRLEERMCEIILASNKTYWCYVRFALNYRREAGSCTNIEIPSQLTGTPLVYAGCLPVCNPERAITKSTVD